MLLFFTLLVDSIAMASTLWLAFYLLGRGFPSQIALRAVVVLLALSLFFSLAFLKLYQIEGTTALRAILLVIALATWYSLTYQLLPVHTKKRLRWLKIAIYTLGGVTIVIMSTTNAFPGEQESLLWVGRMGLSPAYFIYGIFQLLGCSGILYNLLTEDKIGLNLRAGIYYWHLSSPSWRADMGFWRWRSHVRCRDWSRIS